MWNSRRAEEEAAAEAAAAREADMARAEEEAEWRAERRGYVESMRFVLHGASEAVQAVVDAEEAQLEGDAP